VTIGVITAGGTADWEGRLVAGLAGGDHGVRVVRRCVDVAELLATAASGAGRVALVSAELRGLDRDVLTRLAVAGVAVVGVAGGGQPGSDRLSRLGIRCVVDPAADAGEVATALIAAVGSAGAPAAYDLADPSVTLPRPAPAADDVVATVGGGRVGAVWGPTGAPGRSSVAVGLASELAELGVPTLLVDADVYGGVIAQLLGLLDESAGLAAACRVATNGELAPDVIDSLAVTVRPRLRVLTGIARADRWPELRATAFEAVLGCAREVAAVTVVDCGFSIERDEEVTFDTAAPRRNGVTLSALAGADQVVAVAAADPVGLQRYVRASTELAATLPGCAPLTVVNRVRPAVVGGGDARAQISAALARFAGVDDVRFVPDDPAAFDAAVATGRALLEAAPGSPARVALRALAAEVGQVPAPASRRGLLRRVSR
jgi:Flp pilus assembly CpaE family ATPase